MSNQTGKVTQLQIYMLFTLYLFTTILGFRLSTLAAEARFTTWLALLCGSFLGFLITYLNYRLAVKRPEAFFGHYGKKIMWKWLHYPLVSIMIFACIFTASYIMREIQDFTIEVYLPATPAWAVSLLFGICVAYAVRSGVHTIFRCAQGVFFFSVTGMLLIPTFVATEMNMSMFPALFTHYEPAGVWNAAYLTAAMYGEAALIVFIFPYFANGQRTMRSIGWAMISSLFIIFSSLVPGLLIFGPDLGGNLNYPELELIRFIRTESFLENLDPVMMGVWLTSVFLKISLLTYAGVILLTHTFYLSDHKPFSFVITAIMIGQAEFMVKTNTEVSHLLLNGASSFLISAQLIPVLYLIVDWFRSRLKADHRELSQKN